MAKKKTKRPYSFGEIHRNKWLGNKITEVIGADRKRLGWLWTHTDGRVIVSPHLGFYIWFDGDGERWTQESGAMWLVTARLP